MKSETKEQKLLAIGDRVLIDIFWTYTDSSNPQPFLKGKILDVTKQQYYVCPDGGTPQYVWHAAVTKLKDP